MCSPAPARSAKSHLYSSEMFTGDHFHFPTWDDYDQCHDFVYNPDNPRRLQKLGMFHVAGGQLNELTEAIRKERQENIQLLLIHAAECVSLNCSSANCIKTKGLWNHRAQCQVKARGGCHICKRISTTLQSHARQCMIPRCPVPHCMAIRERFCALEKQRHFQALCGKLIANDPTLTELDLDLEETDYDQLTIILNTMKKNKTVKKLIFRNDVLGVGASLNLAAIILAHPEIQELVFMNVSIVEFRSIAHAVQKNEKLTRLVVENCATMHYLVDCIGWLLTEDALESLALKLNGYQDMERLDISEALLHNKSLKELLLHDDHGVFRTKTFQAIPRMLQVNQHVKTIDLVLPNVPITSLIVSRLAQASEGHASLQKLLLDYNHNEFEEEPTAEPFGKMLHTSPTLQQLDLSSFPGACQLTDESGNNTGLVKMMDTLGNALEDFDCNHTDFEEKPTAEPIVEILHKSPTLQQLDLSSFPVVYQLTDESDNDTGLFTMTDILGNALEDFGCYCTGIVA